MRGYRSGDFWRVCDVCGFDVRASQSLKRWDGLMVCLADWEPQHPQDFVRARKDRTHVPDPRPVPDPTYVIATTTPVQTADGEFVYTVDGQFVVTAT